MMVAVSISGTLVSFCKSMWCCIPEGCHLHTCCYGNLKPHSQTVCCLLTSIINSVYISETSNGGKTLKTILSQLEILSATCHTIALFVNRGLLMRNCGMRFSVSCVTRLGIMTTMQTTNVAGCLWPTVSLYFLHQKLCTNILLSKDLTVVLSSYISLQFIC
jgi:hypothetical protein